METLLGDSAPNQLLQAAFLYVLNASCFYKQKRVLMFGFWEVKFSDFTKGLVQPCDGPNGSR